MFYSPELLTKRDSGFGLLWLAATLGSKSTLKKLTKKSVLTADISHLCDMIATPSEPLALRLSSNLMVGAARVYKLKHEIFVTDVTAVYSTLKKYSDLATSIVVDPKSLQMKKSSVAADKITLTVDENAVLDFEFDTYAFSWNVQNELEEGGSNHASQSSKSIAANRALHTIDESHLQDTSMDEVFDPLDSFDLGNGLGRDAAPFDLGLDDLGWDPQPEALQVDVEFDMDMGADVNMEPGEDLPNEQAVGDRMSNLPEMGSVQREQSVAGSAQSSPRKRRRDENDEDPMLNIPTRPRSILTSPRILADVGNFVNNGPSLNGDFGVNEPEPIRQETPVEHAEGEAATAPQPKAKRAKKQVRILLDARTELTDKELRDARDNYLQEQARLRLEHQQQQFNKEAADRVQELLLAPPAIIGAELLRELWTNTFLAQVELKTGAVTLVNAEPRKRARKRRRIGESQPESEAGEVEVPMGDEGGVPMDIDQNPFLGGGDDWGNANGDDQMGPFVIGSDRIRSSEEPEHPRAAASPIPSVQSIEMYRGQDLDFDTQHSGLLPWDNAAPSSSANEAFLGSIGSKGSHRGSLPGVIDTHIELRSLSGSHRGTPVSGRQSPALPADLPDAPLEDYQLLIDDEAEQPDVATQLTEVTPEVLERNALNFLAFTRMQQNLKDGNGITLDDMIASTKTPHVAASAFYCCLVLATKNLLHVRQTETFGTITLELVG